MDINSESNRFLSGNSGFDYSLIYTCYKTNTVAQIKMSVLISKYLPVFMYIYIAPKKVENSNRDNLPFPYLLEK